jgi:type VI secretion system protein ImpC
MHSERFQQVESAWRGCTSRQQHRNRRDAQDPRHEHLEEGPRQDLKKYKGTAWDQSPVFKKLYEQEYGQLGGEPYGCLVGDYYFDHTPGDVELLGQMAQIAAAAHRPFLAAAPDRHGHGYVAGTRESARPGKIFSSPEVRRVALSA